MRDHATKAAAVPPMQDKSTAAPNECDRPSKYSRRGRIVAVNRACPLMPVKAPSAKFNPYARNAIFVKVASRHATLRSTSQTLTRLRSDIRIATSRAAGSITLASPSLVMACHIN
ncbi:hypothetical protein GCM10009097_59180 [Pigmentiphaga daeguensis]|uniref:Uncharacterized protein n=1 Tax=Pigmentiphaga daeguensis TaxID=414049 RepID=A0ABN1D4Q3_9BURK